MPRTRTFTLTGTALLLIVMMGISAEAAVVLPASPTEQPDSEHTRKVVDASNDLGIALYRTMLDAEGSENLFLSPYSIYAALSMTAEGARHNTADEMRDLLGIQRVIREDGAPAVADYGALLHRHMLSGLDERFNAEDKPYELVTANRIWGDAETTFEEDFLQTLASHYGAEMGEVDFRQDPEAARQRINDWVAEQTQDRIQDLMPEGSIDPLTRMVLANAIYFKGDWMNPFPEGATQDRDFYLTEEEVVEVPTMHQADVNVRFQRNDDRLLLELPYRGRELSMLIAMPRQADGLAELEAGLSAEQLREWEQDMSGGRANIWLPRFEIESEKTLNDYLKDLGIRDAFNPREADFTGMTDEEELYISIVQHKAWVAVDEEGTEAAAATGIGMRTTSTAVGPPPVDLRVDRPFVFVIRENATGTALFMGRVTDPRD